MNILLFTLTACLLWLSGYLLSRTLCETMLARYIALPIGVFINAIALVCLTILRVPFSGISIGAMNIVLLVILIICFQPFIKRKSIISNPQKIPQKIPRPLLILSSCILLSTIIYGVVHSLLPTFHYDSMTNWNIRSKVSLNRAELIFSDTSGYLEKPQYPPLYHALQITAVTPLSSWSDPVANGAHALLSASLILAVGYVLMKRAGVSAAVMTMALLLGTPLMTMHAGQSYADFTLIGFALLSFVLLMESAWLPSALLMAACVWTKSEGLFFCFIPWVCTFVWQQYQARNLPWHPLIVGVTLALLWPLFAVVSGMPLTPHGDTDALLTLSVPAMQAVVRAMFVSGSFGVSWYLLLPAVAVTVWKYRSRTDWPAYLWGLMSLGGYLFVYTCTSNASYLLSGQSFDRQLLLPMSLLILGLTLQLAKYNSVLTR